MKKLTAEKCRNKIEHFREVSKTWQLSIEAEYTLQALEIALPILEQQEMITDSQPVITDSERMITDSDERGDGWIEWRGGASGSCPVAYTTLVEVQSRIGHVAEDCAEAFEWCHEADDDDIIAYRIISEQPTNQNGEQ